MVARYNSDTNTFASRLDAYARQARQGRRQAYPSTGRKMARGALASVLPLAAAAGGAMGQCIYTPATVVLSSGQLFGSVAVGPGSSERINFQWASVTSIVSAFGTYPGYALRFFGPGSYHLDAAAAYPASQAFSPRATSLINPVADICSGDSAYSVFGNFCPDDGPGYMVFQNVNDGRLGWMQLQVTQLSAGGAIIQIGTRGIFPGTSVHAGDCALSLPVELVSFAATHTQNGVALTWQTASEINNAGFEIQRAGANQAFRKVAFIDGHGSTSDPQSYSFVDKSAEPNVQYRYRLQQIDYDGTTSFSQVVEVFTEDPGHIALSEFYPNPATNGHARFDVNIADAQAVTTEVYDVRGALVVRRSGQLNAGQNHLSLKTDQLATGMHFAKIQVGERVLYRQFLVQH